LTGSRSRLTSATRVWKKSKYCSKKLVCLGPILLSLFSAIWTTSMIFKNHNYCTKLLGVKKPYFSIFPKITTLVPICLKVYLQRRVIFFNPNCWFLNPNYVPHLTIRSKKQYFSIFRKLQHWSLHIVQFGLPVTRSRSSCCRWSPESSPSRSSADPTSETESKYKM
jgi:hypothetical protein